MTYAFNVGVYDTSGAYQPISNTTRLTHDDGTVASVSPAVSPTRIHNEVVKDINPSGARVQVSFAGDVGYPGTFLAVNVILDNNFPGTYSLDPNAFADASFAGTHIVRTN